MGGFREHVGFEIIERGENVARAGIVAVGGEHHTGAQKVADIARGGGDSLDIVRGDHEFLGQNEARHVGGVGCVVAGETVLDEDILDLHRILREPGAGEEVAHCGIGGFELGAGIFKGRAVATNLRANSQIGGDVALGEAFDRDRADGWRDSMSA